MPNLIILSDFTNYKVIPQGSEAVRRLDPCILEAENIDLKPLIGVELLADLRDLASTNLANNILLMARLKPVLIYFSWARYVREQQIIVSNFGTVQKTNEFSERVSEVSVKEAVSKAISDALAYWLNPGGVREYLCTNASLFPLYKPEINSARHSSIRITTIKNTNR